VRSRFGGCIKKGSCQITSNCSFLLEKFEKEGAEGAEKKKKGGKKVKKKCKY
jgi:hypothetical protein